MCAAISPEVGNQVAEFRSYWVNLTANRPIDCRGPPRNLQMTPIPISRPVSSRRNRLFAAIALLALLALPRCSVYDASLLTVAEMSPVNSGGANLGGSSYLDAGEAGEAAAGTSAAGTSAAGQLGMAGAAASNGGMGFGDGGAAGSSGSGAAGAGDSGGNAGTLGAAGSGGSPPMTHELALSRPVTVSTQEANNPGQKANDGVLTTRWAASSSAMPQWWQVDLGDVHQLSQLALRFEHSDRTYGYIVEASKNGAVYTQEATVNGIGAVQMVDLTGAAPARYVKITVTKAVSPIAGQMPYASLWDISVFGF